ncbi:MAG TPA: Fe-S cluster assembly protein IscX [Phycisphaerales bacterium]|nr:Fe-S cluster assembly protein IscX [Phycisphaerales bacterium]
MPDYRDPREKFHWLDVDRIAEELYERYPDQDPIRISFPDLTGLVRSLHGFREEAGHPVNEKILEAIQSRWMEERLDGGPGDDDDRD